MTLPEHPGAARKLFVSAVVTLLISTAVWAVWGWPLPRHLGSGITMSSRNIEKGNARSMIPGDHLQLLYHFWLFGDMLRGHSGYEKNVYEFNTGNDEDRSESNTYFYPFCLSYVLGEAAGGRAWGWNLTVFLSLWLAYFFTVRLLLRYTRWKGVAYAAGLLSLLLPYRWLTLLGGSPTGFCMVWVPLLMLGLDHAVRDQRIRGGLAAALAVWMMFLGDHHVYFFVALFLVPWIAWLWAYAAVCDNMDGADGRAPSSPPGRRPLGAAVRGLFTGRRVAALLLPFLVLALTALFLKGESGRLNESFMAGGRTLSEVRAFSPSARGLMNPFASALDTQVYVGGPVALLLVLGLIAAVIRRRTAGGYGMLSALLLVLLGIVGMVLVALGMRGPSDGLMYRICRDVIPHFNMIRQTGKIYCLMPFVLAIAATLSISAVWKAFPRAWTAAGLGALLAGLAVESRLQVSPTLCLLRPDQPAYAAVADDARSAGKDPRALVLPLWPGDSHEASTYEYYVSLYRIRMVNGYSPVVTRDYFENVFLRFESANMGELTDAQLDELLGMGVEYLLLHEDQFPDKVSPFPVVFTRERLLGNLRLQLLQQGDRVWALKILKEPRPPLSGAKAETVYFPSRVLEAENAIPGPTVALDGEDASGGRFVRIPSDGSPVLFRMIRTVGDPSQHWMLRVRGEGRMVARQAVEGKPPADASVDIQTSGWEWFPVPLHGPSSFGDVQLSLINAGGGVEVDVVLLAAGAWPPLAPGESRMLPAPCFFRAGYTNDRDQTVVFRSDTEAEGAIFYGPFLPLEPGRYEMIFHYSSSAPDSTPLGEFRAGYRGSSARASVPVLAGTPARLMFDVQDNLPLMLVFDYRRGGDMEIRGVEIRRTESEP